MLTCTVYADVITFLRPANLSDPNLTVWKKDPLNPISFPGMGGGFAGPSNLWTSANVRDGRWTELARSYSKYL